MHLMTSKGVVGEWLEHQFLDWQRKEGERRTVEEFATWLGVSRGTFNKWLNGDRKPDGESIAILAEKLGVEIYDVLDVPRPDPELQAIIRNWARIPAEKRRRLHDDAGRYATEGEKHERARRSS
jgi:transcriptional regulator with XRE-family HTH domain